MTLAARKTSFGLVLLALAAYVAGFALYYPNTITVTDEGLYIIQGLTFAQGHTTRAVLDPRTGETHAEPLPRYAPGNAALMVPFIKLFGWRGAFIPAILSTLVAVLVLARWLADVDHSPLWAILLLTYLPFLVLGRNGMSDVPSAALTVLTLWLFWRGGRRPKYWLLAGFTAGCAPLLRETNVILLAPFLVGALVRRRRGVLPLILGGLVGLAVHVTASFLVFGNVTARSGEFAAFSLRYVPQNLPAYLVAVLILCPGGAIAAALYRGEWAPELKVAVFGFLLFFLTWWYAGAESGAAKGLVLGAGRFCIPLVPLLVFSMADVVPRLYRKLLDRVGPSAQRGLQRLAVVGTAAVVAGAVLLSFAVHVGLYRWAQSQMQIVRAVHETIPPGSVVLTNGLGTNKAFHPVFGAQFGPKHVLEIAQVSSAEVGQMLDRGRRVWVAILFRSDSPQWLKMDAQNQALVDRLKGQFQLRPAYDRALTALDTLRVWEVVGRAAATTTPIGQSPTTGPTALAISPSAGRRSVP